MVFAFEVAQYSGNNLAHTLAIFFTQNSFTDNAQNYKINFSLKFEKVGHFFPQNSRKSDAPKC
ncbi:MAG: hypothetical protein EAZ92_01200 [Candidatus Kapaibacterium sp.]|nr:MAG: hypothetical protein EAZ92_01200 [Candidatus Kapabacteria bacterium]